MYLMCFGFIIFVFVCCVFVMILDMPSTCCQVGVTRTITYSLIRYTVACWTVPCLITSIYWLFHKIIFDKNTKKLKQINDQTGTRLRFFISLGVVSFPKTLVSSNPYKISIRGYWDLVAGCWWSRDILCSIHVFLEYIIVLLFLELWTHSDSSTKLTLPF